MNIRARGLMAATALALGAAFLAGGCGGGSSGGGNPPADFVKRVTTQFSLGQSGRLWDELLHADQQIVTRARFVACQANEGWNLKSIKVLDTYSDPVNVGAKTLKATAVTVRVTSDEAVTTATMHAVSSGGVWHWLLQPSDRSAYQSGKCPPKGG